MNKLCNIKECPYCRAEYKFNGGVEPLTQIGKCKCYFTKNDNKNIISNKCTNKNYMNEMLLKYGR